MVFRPSSSRCICWITGKPGGASWNTMLAEIYGMMPSANTVAREKPPPANKSYRLNSVPCPAFRRKSARAWTLTPGVAMCAPMRYTSRHRSVKRIFSFSSGTLNRLGICGAVTGSTRDRSARLLDFGPGGGGDRHAPDRELPRHLAHPQQLDGAVRAAHQAGAEQCLGGHLDAFREPRESADVHHLGGLLERVGEAALRDAADERHLSALEPGTGLPAAASRLSLASPARRLADPRAGAAALADTRTVRPRRGVQARERDPLRGHRRPPLGLALHLPLRLPRLHLLRLRLRRRHRLLRLGRARHLDEVPNLIEHAAKRRVVPLHDRVLVVLEPERLEGSSLNGRMADPRSHLSDAQFPPPPDPPRPRAHGAPPRLPFAFFAPRRSPA